jgi:hypothetical protein
VAQAQAAPAQGAGTAREAPRPQDIDPAVDTSAPAQTASEAPPEGSSSTARPPSQDAAGAPATEDASAATDDTRGDSAGDATAAADAARDVRTAPAQKSATEGKRNAVDRIELDTTQITGNRELPKVLYIVPWKRADLGDLTGRPVNSLLDEVLAPVDRDVFRRENRYYDALMPEGSQPAANAPSQGAGPAAAPVAAPAEPGGSAASASAAPATRDER